ncbi:hypothetical protein EDB80DRAFT_897653 [Ilyonectria destructans]|nr:hypothetical protein EDB80DRAFT_897653 [Ilyonectria destructans]
MATKTRYDISLNTGSSTDASANENYFDQVTALSQGIINASFLQLFDSIEGIAEISYSSRQMGQMDAVLGPPSIMINGLTTNGLTTNATEVMYMLRIKSGTFVFPDYEERQIHDWVLAVPVKIIEQSLDETPGDSPNARSRKKRWLNQLKGRFPGFVPGDYSVQRIFCALASAGWSVPNEELSTVWDPVTKSRMRYKDFANRNANSRYKEQMVSMLRGWAAQDGEDSVGTIGIKFKLPEEQVKANIPTFRPVHIYNQVYPYLKDDKDSGGMAIGDYSVSKRTESNPYGELDDRDYNCLLYCENVDAAMGAKEIIMENGEEKMVDNVVARPLPINLKLGHNGNLAEPGGIYGSFVMDHRAFTSLFLLPQLQELCLGTYMQVGVPHRVYDPATNSARIHPKYAIGCELDGKSPLSADDPFFKLQRVAESHYRWSQKSVESGRDKVYSYTKPETPNSYFAHNNYDISAESSVEVKWEPGTPRLQVSGQIVYDYYTAFASSQDMKTNVEEFDYKGTGTWSIAIVLKTFEKEFEIEGKKAKRRALQPVIEGLNSDNTPASMVINFTDRSGKIILEDKTKTEIGKQLNQGFARGISIVINNIEKRFRNTGKFSYPGYGELEYTDPKFTRLGNIIATVNYKPPSHNDGFMYFPPKVDHKAAALEQPSIPEPRTSSFEGNSQAVLH